MARPRQKLDWHRQCVSLQKQLKEEPPGWRRERLMAGQLGLLGEQNLEQIAAAVGRGRSTLQEWVSRYRQGGTPLLLEDRRAPNTGAQRLLGAEGRGPVAAGLGQG